MVFIKRILASLTNFLLILLVVLIAYPVFNHFEIDFDDKTFYLIIFSIVYFIPIFYLKSTVGLKILKIEVDSSQKLFLKYFIYYLITAQYLGAYCSMFSELFNFKRIGTTILSIQVALFLIHLIMFAFSGGKYNLLDFVFNIKHAAKNYSRTNEKRLIIWLSFCYLVAFTAILADKYNIISFYKFLVSTNSSYNFTNYYPAEVFDNYADVITEKFVESNKILIYSDTLSLIQDKFLGQKTIYATINKEVFDNIAKRNELCKKLTNYSSVNDYINDRYGEVDQTKIVLSYIKPNTFVTSLSYTYFYYYDNKDAKGIVYGGIDLDSLIKSYKSYDETLLRTISNILNVDEENLKARIVKEGQLVFSNDEIVIINASPEKFTFPFNLRPISFDSVRPLGYLNFSFPKGDVSLEGIEISLSLKSRYYEAINLRNYIYYNYFVNSE